MSETTAPSSESQRIKNLPRNVWAVGFTSLLMDISSEMVVYLIPLFLSNVLGVQTSIIGFIDGIAEATASILKLFSGWFSDRMGGRKWLAVAGYGLSAVVKPFYYFAQSWGMIAGVRWADRIGKGIRTAPRDALVADSTRKEMRGLAFGFHRAMDTVGAMIGLLIATLVVWRVQANSLDLSRSTFQIIVLISMIPAFLAVFCLAIGAKDVPVSGQRNAPKFSLKNMGKPFSIFLVIVSIFTLGNSSDSFLVLRAQNLGLSVTGIMIMVAVFNLVYAAVSTPAGSLSDRIGRRRLIVGGWLVYAVIYLGFAVANAYLAGLAALCCIWAILWIGLWISKCPGSRPGSRKYSRDCLWNIPCGDRFAGIPGIIDCGNLMGRRLRMGRFWPIGTFPVWRTVSPDSGVINDFLDAKDYHTIVHVIDFNLFTNQTSYGQTSSVNA